MRIWIDLANSPQVLFFRPLIPIFEDLGHRLTITSRHYAQTVGLADHYGLTHTPIGGHGGKKLGKIGMSLFNRTWELVRFARNRHFDMAISHNSYAQAMAAQLLGISFATSMDYEHQPANHLSFRLAQRVVVPRFFPKSYLRKYGATFHKVRYYAGTKEEIYLSGFIPTPNYRENFHVNPKEILIVMRPPGTWTLYHHFDNPLFEKVLEFVARQKDTKIVFLPRLKEQKQQILNMGYPNIIIPPKAVDGPNLMSHADLVIGAGGSMNREAAVLGAKAYSLYAGKLAAVDRYLMKQGKMTHIRSHEDIDLIRVQKNKSRGTKKDQTSLIHETARLFLT